MIYERIDAAILGPTTALVHLADRRLGWNRHDLRAAIKTGQLGILGFSLASMVVALASSPHMHPAVPFAATVVALLLLTTAFRTWRIEHGEAMRLSRSLETYVGWQADMDLTRIHSSIREGYGGRLLLVGEAFLTAFLVGVACVVLAGPATGGPAVMLPLVAMTVRNVADTVARYVLSVPPAPPGSSQHEIRGMEATAASPT